jgi:hypothetical protein
VTLEQILVVAVLVLAPLLNVLVRVLRRRLAGPAPRESGPKAPETPARLRTLSSSLGAQRGGAGGIPPSVPQPPLTEVLRPRRRPKVRIGSAREARRGIVLMAVLGPCRGLEPPRLMRRRQPHA